jgi:hypothetical protein
MEDVRRRGLPTLDCTPYAARRVTVAMTRSSITVRPSREDIVVPGDDDAARSVIGRLAPYVPQAKRIRVRYVIFARLKRFAEIRQALAEFINSPQFLKQLAKE